MRTKIVNAVILAFICLTLQQCNKPKEWESFKFDKYGYWMDFPSEPEYTPQKVNTEIGALDLHFYMLDNTKKGGNYYSSAYSEYPDSILHSDKKELLDGFFKASIEGAVKNIHGELLSEKIIDINGYPGREIKVSAKSISLVLKMRIFLVENKVYMLQVLTPIKNDFNKSINKFLDSFELIHKAQ